MNGTFEILVTLAFFIPMAATVALNLALYAGERYTLQPPAPRLARAAENTALAEEAAHELRKAA